MKILNSVEEVIQHVHSGQSLFVHGGLATPNTLLKELVRQHNRLRNVELMHLHTHGEAEYARPEYKESFRVTNFFIGGNMRKYLNYDNVDYLPCFLSEIPLLFRKGVKKVDVALIHVSPPDEHGFVTLGTSVDIAKAAVECAQMVIAQINPNMPRVHGDGFVHVSKIDYAVMVNDELDDVKPAVLGETELKIGANIASLIPDGATLQMGIGSIPDAALAALKNHRHLGIHSEMWSDGCLDLIESGAVDNSKKVIHPGKTISTFVVGSRRVQKYLHDNPSVIQASSEYVNNPSVIKRNPKVIAINSCIEIDLTGQICADSIGHKIFSGVGGQMDFMRAASLSDGGKPIMSLTSVTTKGLSKIVPSLKAGAGVVTTRSHVHYVATEWGIADLYGKTLNERARELIKVAHPDHREMLDREWHRIYREL